MKEFERNLEKEIQIVETLIRQLNQCLFIFHKEHKHKEFRNTIVDVHLCKKELKRLIAAREAEMNVGKGVARNEVVQAMERSGKSIS
jgi:hypothetical protein